MDLLKVKAVSKTYGSGEGQVQALKDASFTIGKGMTRGQEIEKR